jgi:hypothetical protein
MMCLASTYVIAKSSLTCLSVCLRVRPTALFSQMASHVNGNDVLVVIWGKFLMSRLHGRVGVQVSYCSHYPSIYIKNFVTGSDDSEATKFRVTVAMSFWSLTRCMYIRYIGGLEQTDSDLFRFNMSGLWELIIFWRRYICHRIWLNLWRFWRFISFWKHKRGRFPYRPVQ